MKKIGILSMQEVNNYGSVLQAYALKQLVSSLGYEVFFLGIKPSVEDDSLLIDREEYIEDNEYKSDFFSKLKKLDRYFFNRLHHKINSKKQAALFEEFRQKYLQKTDESQRFDTCIIGSDEVFNCLLKSRWGFTSQLYGNIPNADKVITYAASCGSTSIEMVPAQVKNRIKESFGNISAFSVRDENTRCFVKSIAGIDPLVHYDPVVITDFEKEIETAEFPEILKNRRYCIIYSYPNRFHDKNDIKNIIEFCQKRKMEIVTLGGYQMWIKNSLAVEPFSLLKIFKEAEFVITDTFHGAIFSEKYAKRYAVIVRRSNSNKLLDLARKLSIEKHIISNTSELETVFAVGEDKQRIRAIEKDGYTKSKEYLKMRLSEDVDEK